MRLILILIAICLSCSPSVKAAKEPRDVIERLKSNEIELTDEIKCLNEMHRADRKRLVCRIVELEGSGSNVEFSVITSNHDVSSENYFDTGAAVTNNKSIEIYRY